MEFFSKNTSRKAWTCQPKQWGPSRLWRNNSHSLVENRAKLLTSSFQQSWELCAEKPRTIYNQLGTVKQMNTYPMSLLSSSNLSHKMKIWSKQIKMILNKIFWRTLIKFLKKVTLYGYSFFYITNSMDQFCQCELQNQLKDAATSLKWFCNSLLVGWAQSLINCRKIFLNGP